VISSDHLEAGAAGQIKASVDTTGKSGNVEKHITVFSNDSSNPMLSLSLIMEVVQK
jgi:Protein of unknown function (DUF1573)